MRVKLLDVALQVGTLGKLGRAVRTTVRALLVVDSIHMSVEVKALAKALSAVGAVERLVLLVHGADMLVKV